MVHKMDITKNTKVVVHFMDNKSTQSGHDFSQNDDDVQKVSFKCTLNGHYVIIDRVVVHKMDK